MYEKKRVAGVLVVDDERSIRITLREFLRNDGYEVFAAADAIEAVAILKENEIDVVISDIVLPKRSGVELLHDLLEISPYLKIIMMTGEPTVDTATEALRMGTFDYLTKPVGKAAVLDIVAKATALKSLEDENRMYREKLEQLVEERTLQVKESEAKYKSIVDNLAVGVSLLSPELRILELNRQMREWHPDVDIDRRTFCYQAYHNPPLAETCEECPALKTLKDGKVHDTTTVMQGSGCALSIHMISSPILDEEGKVSAVILIMEDITERMLLETQLRQSQKLESIGTLASGIAHDINNTLAPIVLYTDALLESEELTEQGVRFLKTIRRASRDIESTVGRLRMFYKKDSADYAQIKAIDPGNLFTEVIDMTQPRWRDLAQKNGTTIQIKTEIQENMPALSGVESEIREGLVNLVFNGVDAMPHGGTITLRTGGNQQHIVLEVTDTGVGMNAEHKDKCIEPFFTTKGEKGSGLGLAMVFGAMRRHQGKMEIDSEEGKGTTVRLIFPVRKEASHGPNVDEVATDLPALKVLCIDDEPAVREALREIMEIDGHSATVAGSGETGIAAFREAIGGEGAFDVVITDLGMPDMDGWEVAEQIKGISPETPVFMLSGWGDLMQGESNETRTVDVILGKPPKIDDIRKALRKGHRT